MSAIIAIALSFFRWMGSGLLDLLHMIPREWIERFMTLLIGGVIAWSACYIHYGVPALKADRATLTALRTANAKGDALARQKTAEALKGSWQAGYAAGKHTQFIADTLNPIIRKVPIYVSAKSDAACPVPWGFVRVWDALSTGTDIDTVRSRVAPGQPDDARSDVTLSEIVSLYGAAAAPAHQNASQLNDLIAFERAAAQ